MMVAHAFTCGIPRADVDVTEFSTKTPFRNACRIACSSIFLRMLGEMCHRGTRGIAELAMVIFRWLTC